jgi:hypothetical protein
MEEASKNNETAQNEKSKTIEYEELIRLTGSDAVAQVKDLSRISAIKRIAELKTRAKKLPVMKYTVNGCEVTVYGKRLPLSILNKNDKL